MAARFVAAWTIALAGSAAAYQPIAHVGRRAAMTGLRAAPVMAVVQHKMAESEDDAVLAEQAIARGVSVRSEAGVAAARAAAAVVVAALHADLAAGAFSAPPKKHKDALYKALKKPKGAMALIGEGAQQDRPSLGGMDLNDPRYLSDQFRQGNCAAVCVRVGGEYELGPRALAETADEQQTARGEFPGPLPVLSRADVIDAVQLAKAAADGASAAIISLHLNGAEATKALMASAESYGLEPVLRVGTAEELATAVELGAKIVVLGEVSLPQAGALIAAAPAEVRTVCDAFVRDVRGAWKARDMGFSALLVGDTVLEVCCRDRVPPTAVLKAMLAKGSVKYGLGMQKGRLEGAKEQLGELC